MLHGHLQVQVSNPRSSHTPQSYLGLQPLQAGALSFQFVLVVDWPFLLWHWELQYQATWLRLHLLNSWSCFLITVPVGAQVLFLHHVLIGIVVLVHVQGGELLIYGACRELLNHEQIQSMLPRLLEASSAQGHQPQGTSCRLSMVIAFKCTTLKLVPTWCCFQYLVQEPAGSLPWFCQS